jgi:Zn finger protein HypA/HybF involved in hydrogenase expression
MIKLSQKHIERLPNRSTNLDFGSLSCYYGSMLKNIIIPIGKLRIQRLYRCTKCQYEWYTDKIPKNCAKCKRRSLPPVIQTNPVRPVLHCRKCAHIWSPSKKVNSQTKKLMYQMSATCPRCRSTTYLELKRRKNTS